MAAAGEGLRKRSALGALPTHSHPNRDAATVTSLSLFFAIVPIIDRSGGLVAKKRIF